MLNKKNLIGNPKVIEDLFKKGKIFKDDILIFKYMETDGLPRFVVSVSKKIYKKANKRNRLRRQLQESIRLNLPVLNKKIIALITVRPSINDSKYDFQSLNKSITKFFNTI